MNPGVVCTHREILLVQTEIRFYLLFSDWFESKRTSVWHQINWKMVNTIWFRVDLIRFRNKFSVCILIFPLAVKPRNNLCQRPPFFFISTAREAGVSLHHRVPIEGPLKKPLVHHSTTVLRGLRDALKWALKLFYEVKDGRFLRKFRSVFPEDSWNKWDTSAFPRGRGGFCWIILRLIIPPNKI